MGIRGPLHGPVGHSGSVTESFTQGRATPVVSALGMEATPPITGGWDHRGPGNRSLRDDSQERLIADEPRPTIPRSPRVNVWRGSVGLHQAVAPAIGV